MDRADTASVGISVVGHAALFAMALMFVGRAGAPPVPPPMEVSYVDEIGLTSAAPEPTPAPEQGMAPEVGAPEDAPSEPAPPMPAPRAAPPTPQPAPRQAERAPSPTRERATQPDRRQQSGPTQRNSDTGQTNRRPLIGDDILKGIGRDPSPSRSQQSQAAMTGAARASLNAAIARALRPCERQALPSPEAASINVRVNVSLNPDGSLVAARVTRVDNPNPALAMYERRMQDLALAVVRQCTPIRGLPSQYYDVSRGWRQFTYVFDPRTR